IVFNSVLTTTQVNSIESYLAVKYGITLKNNQGAGASIPYYASNGTTVTWNGPNGFHNHVIGIGRDDAFGLYQRISKSTLSLNTDTDVIALAIGNFQAVSPFA